MKSTCTFETHPFCASKKATASYTLTSHSNSLQCNMQLLQGKARKISVPVVAVSLLGWILYIIGFAAVNNGTNYKTGFEYAPNSSNCPNISYLGIPSQRASLYWFPHWMVVIAGPFLYILTILNLIFAKWFTGLPAQFLTSLYLVCGGAVIYTWAVELFDSSALIAVARYCPPADWLTDANWGLWPLIEWVGALSSVVFLTAYIMLWTWFSDPEPKYVEYEEEEEYEEQGGEYEEEQGEYEEGEQGEEGDKDQEPETTVE